MIKFNAKDMFNTRKLVHTALFISLGIILPMAFHAVPNAGGIFLPMHIPVLLCGILCGFPLGLICGGLTPVLSSLLTGMPPAAMLPSMVFELAAYGTVTSLLMRVVRIKNFYVKIYIVLISAMLCGRAVYGVLNALIFAAGDYSLSIWLTAAFITSWPGILIQIILIPAVLIAFQKARLFNFDNKKVKAQNEAGVGGDVEVKT
ncbi:MAG: ECF transporter S component [Firmicutes bacterium]|nr:ECF transporter S component [Bacillota bacterium]